MGGLLSFRLGADSALGTLLTPDRRPLNRGDANFTHVLFVLVANPRFDLCLPGVASRCCRCIARSGVGLIASPLDRRH